MRAADLQRRVNAIGDDNPNTQVYIKVLSPTGEELICDIKSIQLVSFNGIETSIPESHQTANCAVICIGKTDE